MGKAVRERKIRCADCNVRMRLLGKSRRTYVCPDCNASLIANKYGQPLGTPATKDVRNLRRRAHIVFDRLWKSGEVTRSSAQRWLAKELRIAVKQCHFGYMNRENLERVIQLCDGVHDGRYPGPKAIDEHPETSKNRRMANKDVKLLREAGAHPTALRYWVARTTSSSALEDVGGFSSKECIRLILGTSQVFSGQARPPRGVRIGKSLKLAGMTTLNNMLRELESDGNLSVRASSEWGLAPDLDA